MGFLDKLLGRRKSEAGEACGVRKLDSCGEAVFVDESAEAIAALDASCGWTHDVERRCVAVWRCEVQ